ncbi:MAG TPA: archaetidylserine decarboxylase [Steroidobacteraceae bacterium]|nr:archaetidylserine decarboxylase [Steroidobacteraceae bacterium]
MTARSLISRMTRHEKLNFLLTNRIPRRWVTLCVGRLSRVRQPAVRAASIAIWRLFSDLDLREARKARFESLHDCFTRELKEGVRPVDPDPAVLTSPCDGIVGEGGRVVDGVVLQAKGFPYSVQDLLGDAWLAEQYRDGSYVTLRLTSSMYHRFHAPADCRVERVTYISGDTWNVNPIALKRIERLFCKNERAAIRCRLAQGRHLITLVPVAAILVASIRLRFLDVLLHLRYRGPNHIECDAPLRKGEEMGWFEHGSTIIVFAPAGVTLCERWKTGDVIRMGQPLFQLPEPFRATAAEGVNVTPVS